MDGRAFLIVSQELQAGPSEAHRRAAVGRAYYALLHEGFTALQRWGITMPPRENLHTFVRIRFNYSSEADLQRFGRLSDELRREQDEVFFGSASMGSRAVQPSGAR